MPSSWVRLKDVIRASVTWEALLERLKSGEVRAQAGVLFERHLLATTCDISTDRIIYLGTDRILHLQDDVANLSDGEHRLMLSGRAYTVARHGTSAIVYWDAAQLRKITHEDLMPDFWVTAKTDIETSFAFADNLQGAVRTEASEIVVSRDDVGRFWPSLVTQHQHTSEAVVLPPGRKRGRKLQYDWEGALIHAMKFIHDNGLPAEPKDLIKVLLDWFLTQDKHPDQSEVGKRVTKIFDKLQPD